MNSDSTQTTDFFSIYTYYGDTITDPTDKSVNQIVKMTPATIGVVSVASSDPQVGQQATYTFSYTVKSKFLPNAKIRIGKFIYN